MNLVCNRWGCNSTPDGVARLRSRTSDQHPDPGSIAIVVPVYLCRPCGLELSAYPMDTELQLGR